MSLSLMGSTEPMRCGYPDYKNVANLGGEGTFTMSENGFFQFVASSNSTTAQIFYRIKVNDAVVYQGYTETRDWNYYTSPLIPVQKGDVVVTQGETQGVVYTSYFYKER